MSVPRRRPPFAAACLLALVASLLWTAPARAVTDLLPDLVAEPPSGPRPLEVTRFADGRDHLLLRFDGSIHNIGAGPLEIRGSAPANGAMTVTGQRIYRSDSTFRNDNSRHPVIRFEDTDGHSHWHLQGAARYSLWDAAGAAQVAPSAKVGFCMLDSERVDGFGPSSAVYTRSATQYCGENRPNASQVMEGISRGWLDFYDASLPFQWVDVSDVAPGQYRLGAEVDPDDFVLEGNEQNNGPALAASLVTVPGYAALGVSASAPHAVRIGLGAQAYGAPGPAVFAVESAPAHGTLNAPPGTRLPAPEVVYTPRPGFAGQDSFTYSVRDAASPFPLRAAAAAVTVTVPGASSRSRARLLRGLRLRRHGRYLRLRARALRSGRLRIAVGKGKRRLGSCSRRVRAGRVFRCRMKLRRHARLRRARLTVRLIVGGKVSAVEAYRVPRRL